MDRILDDIFYTFDDLMTKGQFNKVEEILSKVDVNETDTGILLGYLSASLPGVDKMPSRIEFYRKVEACLIKRCGSQKSFSLLTGLK